MTLSSGCIRSMFLGFVALAFTACGHVPERAADRSAAQLATHMLRKFRSMEEFEEYRRQVHKAADKHGVWWASTIRGKETRTWLATTEVPPCNPAIQECGVGLEEIAVTGSKVTKPASITNNQEADVDEGDIVKQHGRFLIVLQDGRLFSVDTGLRVGELRLADRINVYTSAKTGTWYDELLIHGNSLIVTGYNYMEDASEINVISIGSDGELDFQARYFIESEDYYSGNNYASRMVRGQFLVYTPLHLADMPKGEPPRIPRIRRWTPTEGLGEWQPLFSITDVYRPIQPTLTPTLHVISVCRIKAQQDFGCDSRGVVGPAYREVYVSSDNIYLWLTSDRDEWGNGERWPDECPEEADLYGYPARRSAVFQMPIETNAVRALHTIGTPYDQFAFDERDNSLLALLVRAPQDCYSYDRLPMQLAALPLNAFSTSPAAAASSDYRRLTLGSGSRLSNRFTKNHVVYGAAPHWARDQDEAESNEIIAVYLAQAFRWERLSMTHRVERIEVLGDHAVAFGPADEEDLGVSTLKLGRRASVADTRTLAGVEETEGRSHAFNSLVGDDGKGLFGLPTMYTSKLSHGYWWNTPSDVQFFATDAQLRIEPLGELAGQRSANTDYKCEVSCIDWYGNARPIFIEDRVFALTGSQLIEGRPFGSGIAEVARVDLTGMPQRAH